MNHDNFQCPHNTSANYSPMISSLCAARSPVSNSKLKMNQLTRKWLGQTFSPLQDIYKMDESRIPNLALDNFTDHLQQSLMFVGHLNLGFSVDIAAVVQLTIGCGS